MNIKRVILWRVYLAFFALVIFAVAILYRAFHIGVIEGEKWRTLSEELTTDYQTIEAVRGNIYADDGSLLATSVPIYELRLDFKASGLTDEVFERDIDSLAYYFATTFKDKPASQYLREFKQARKKGSRYYLLKRRLGYRQVKEMRTWPILRLGRLKGGLIVIEKDQRQRPFKLLAYRTIGYSIDGVAPVGLEGAYDGVLSGVSGKRLMQKVAGGVWIPVNADNEIEPENGKDIYTTIDINLQDVATDALYDALVEHDALDGCAVLMEVETGHIKAIANLTRKSEGVYEETFNYAVGQSAEPGSTIKVASLIALLEEGVSLDDSVNVDFGVTYFFDRKMSDSEPGMLEKVTLREAFEKSSNVGISQLVYNRFKNEPARFVDYFLNLGLGDPLDIQIRGEGIPLIKQPGTKGWSGTTLPWMSIGYETQVTPLQILTLYNAIANDGVMVKPSFVTEVRQTGRLIESYKPIVLKEKLCSKNTLKLVRQSLEGVVLNGTAKNLLNENYTVAGKTGTAQISKGGKYSKSFYKSSFVGYFPADNPKYSCIVSINGASKGVIYGGRVAGPVFKEIADKVYANSLQMHKNIKEVMDPPAIETPANVAGYVEEIHHVMNTLGISNKNLSEDSEWGQTRRFDNRMEIDKRAQIKNLVPDVVGMSLKDALYLLENAGLVVVATGNGKVRKQSMPPGTRVYKGSTVVIELR